MKDSIIYQNKFLFPEILWERPVHSYKAHGGRVLILAGSKGKSEVATLTCEAVFRSGTGILTLGFPECLMGLYKDVIPKSMALPLPETPSGSLAKKAEKEIKEQAKVCDTAIIGPGLSENAETIHLVWQLLFELNLPLIISGNGIVALIKGIKIIRSKEDIEFLTDYFKKNSGSKIIVINPKEAVNILTAINLSEFDNIKFNIQYIKSHVKDIIRTLSKYLNTIIVLKDSQIIIVEPNGRLIIENIDRKLEKTTPGDVLSGIIGSFIAQNPGKILEATATAVYLYCLATKTAFKESRLQSASSVIRCLPKAINKAEEETEEDKWPS